MKSESGKEGSVDPVEELIRDYRETGSIEARDAVFASHQGLVAGVVNKFRGKAEREDLLQVGYIGLLQAIERFDLERGFQFTTYATHCVDGELRHFLRDKAEVIRRPRWVRKLSSQIASYLESFLQENERLPTLAEISQALNIEEAGVKAILGSKQPASLDDESGDLVLREAVKSVGHRSFRLPVEDRISISDAFERLLEVEKKVIYLFFVRDLTQRQIAGKLSLTPRKVSRLMQKALGRMRVGMTGRKS